MTTRIVARTDDEIELKIEFLISSVKNGNKELTRAELVRYLIDEKFSQLAGKKSENMEDESSCDTAPDLLTMAEKVNYMFEYLELLLKADSEIKKFYTDINGKYDSEKIKKYVKSESYYRDFVTAKLNKENDKNG